MAFTYIPIPLFSEEHFSQCIVVPFPDGGRIVDTMVVEKTAYILVESRPLAKIIQAHFHVVPVLQTLYADGHEFVGTYKIEDFRGVPLVMYSVIRITEGDYGIYSAEFIAAHGEEGQRKIIEAVEGELKSNEEIPGEIHEETELRRIWDFMPGNDKTNENDSSETNLESE